MGRYDPLDHRCASRASSWRAIPAGCLHSGKGPLRQVNLPREGNGAPAQKMVRLCLTNKSSAKQLIADHWEVKPKIATRPCPVDGTQETNTARKFFLYLLGDYQNLNM